MRTAREVALAVTVLAGLLSLALIGAPVAVVAGISAAVSVSAAVLRPHLRQLPWPLLTVPVLGAVAAWGAWGGGAEEALGMGLAYLQVHRRLSRAGTDDDRVSVLLSALMLVTAGGRTESPWFLVAAVGWAGALPVALLPELAGVRAPRLLLALPLVSLAGSALLFPLLPRTDAALPPVPAAVARTGFADDVELGALDALLDDPAEVLRVTAHPPVEGPLYFRGVALDRFDGRRWWRSDDGVPTEVQAPSRHAGDAVALRIRMQPGPAGTLFTIGRVLALEAGDLGLLRDGQGSWSVEGPVGEALDYGLVVRPPLGPGGPVAPGGVAAPDADPSPWLALPELDPRVGELARSVAPDETEPLPLAAALGAHLRATHAYSRSPDREGDSPLATFLLEGRAGHCEYFASALAVLLRARGVPARVVNGFAGGELDPVTGQIVVRRYHAHSWVEVLADDGWHIVDATPGPAGPSAEPEARWGERAARLWRERVLDWDGADQRAALVTAGRRVEGLLRMPRAPSLPWRGLGLLAAVCLVGATLARLGVRRVARRLAGEAEPMVRGPVARQHRRARRHVARIGWRVPSALPPVAAARWLGRRAPGEAAAAMEELAWLLYAVRYGGEPEGPAAVRARELADRVMRLPPPHANE